MGTDCTKSNDNIYFRCRKEAAKYNDKLNSRESAADLLGVSVSSLADYELGNTKVVPVDTEPPIRTVRKTSTRPTGTWTS